MTKTEETIIDTIEIIFSKPDITAQASSALEGILKIYENVDNAQTKRVIDEYFMNNKPPCDNTTGMFFFLYLLTKNPEYITAAIKSQLPITAPSIFQELFWNTANYCFTSSNQVWTHDLIMRDAFRTLSTHINQSIEARFKGGKRPRALRRVAILSCQMLSMRHSPTREAISMALHLQKNHGLEVFIINANNINYTNRLNIFKPYIGNHNPTLTGQQSHNFDYLNFKDEKVNIISLSPENGNTWRVLETLQILSDLNVDAVISHAENLFLQDAIFGRFPSIFVTTGGVVPYARSDAYWVPTNLFTDEVAELGSSYGHNNFLLENMLCTPEPIAEASIPRKDLGCSDSETLLLCVSTRLGTEIDSGFIKTMSHLLTGKSNLRLLFAGSPTIDPKGWFEDSLKDQVINVGFHTDLSALCKSCDIYVNPMRQGGGTSSQTAILSGLPVVTLNYGHISDIVPPTRRMEDYETYTEYLGRLISDVRLRNTEAQLFKQYLSANLDTTKQMAKLHNYLIDVVGYF